MTEGDQGVSSKSSVSRLNCLQVSCSKDFKTDTSQETFNTVKKKTANFCITKASLICYMSSNFASKRSCLQEITLCSDKNRLYGSARAKPGNLVFRRLLTARNERQVRINLINIAKGTFIALPANRRHRRQCELCKAYQI